MTTKTRTKPKVPARRMDATETANTTALVVLPVEADAAATPATLADIAARWLDHMRGLGKTPATVASYEGDLSIAKTFFGDGAGVPTAEQIAAFDASEAVVRTRKGKPKANPTILKTRRALRLAITWAQAAGLIAVNPYTP